ncbi:MAG: hypothetical protein JXR22_06305 [Prolixibacteraceae bacterium]|nr:hypothetical protein [Prolixibacteraceae bacterium]
MKSARRIFLTGFALLLVMISGAQDAGFQTLCYYEDDTTRLELDLFLPDNVSDGEKVPLLIFVHGGGFKNGTRESAHGFCQFLADEGIAAATITYTLYMADKSFSCDGILTEKIRAIQLAGNQVWKASAYFLNNQDQFPINTRQIFLGGSSAGAEAILHAAYWDRKVMGLYPDEIPETFRYAGLISGAGALMDINLITKENQLSSLFFHGNCDKVVPYPAAPHHYCKGNVPGWLMFFGSRAIHEQHLQLHGSSFLMTFCGGGHEYSWKPFDEERPNILWFIHQTLGDRLFQMHQVISTGNDCDLNDAYPECR